MSYGVSLLDKAAEKCGSYYKLSKQMDISEATISQIRHGKRQVPMTWAHELAQITGDDPGQVLQLLTMERAKKPEKRLRLGKAVAAGVVAMCTIFYGSDSQSAPSTFFQHHQPHANKTIFDGQIAHRVVFGDVHRKPVWGARGEFVPSISRAIPRRYGSAGTRN